MTRLVIFASYDKSGIVHDYVITYLNRLKQVADKIIFIEQARIKHIGDHKSMMENCDSYAKLYNMQARKYNV